VTDANQQYEKKALSQFEYAINIHERSKRDQADLMRNNGILQINSLVKQETEKQGIRLKYFFYRSAVIIFVLATLFSSPSVDNK